MNVAGFDCTVEVFTWLDDAPLGERHVVELVVPRAPERLVDRARLLADPDAPDPPYWAFVWGGARAIAETLARGERPHTGQAVLDLGCGLGLAGLAAARPGVELWCVDVAPEALAFVRESARRSRIDGVTCRALDLRDAHLERRFDWILASDVLYDRDLSDDVLRFVDVHLERRGVLVATDRLLASTASFFRALEARGFDGRAETIVTLEGGQPTPTRVWRWTRRGEPV